MKRNGYPLWASLGLVIALGISATQAFATPPVNSAMIRTRIFNDCPSSIVTTVNTYPTQIIIDDAQLDCFGFANLHDWRLSTDGVNPALFYNWDNFNICATLLLTGTGNGEAGLQVCPWWDPWVEGRLNVKTTGEIACFGGRLPFYTFTGNYGINYTKGNPITLEIDYRANGLSQASPATIEYKVNYLSIPYTSGPLPFDQGNPSEDPPHGQWGILNPAYVGGHFQPLSKGGDPTNQLRAQWTFCDPALPAQPTSWGKVKDTYR